MSILIRDMHFPARDDYTICIVYGDGVVTEYKGSGQPEKTIGSAVKLSPHGRLIEADEAKQKVVDFIEGYSWLNARCTDNVRSGMKMAAKLAIANTTTILEAEEA